jgi:predicted O-linked N-acetylglucosamine transferase (SPINDLY family)
LRSGGSTISSGNLFYSAAAPREERWSAGADAWTDVGALSDADLIAKIRADAIDVLIELDGHTPGNRLRALASKPAPTIVSWLDYFDTPGMEAVDMLIGDSTEIPVDGSQLFVEEVVRIDPCRLCYLPPEYAPAVVPPPALRNGFVTFGSFNRLSKLAEPVLDQWARLLKSVRGSRLILKSAAFAHANTRAVFVQRFALRGVDASRIELRGSTDHRTMLGEYADVDIALDTFPYNGGVTTCEALWMGVPIVGLLGTSMISRQTGSLLRAAGLDRWVANSLDGWLELNLTLAHDLPSLARHRHHAREALASTPLLAGRRFTERFIEGVLRRRAP